jgi:hypothetical protein
MEKLYITRDSFKGGKDIICIQGCEEKFVAHVNESMFPGLANSMADMYNKKAA